MRGARGKFLHLDLRALKSLVPILPSHISLLRRGVQKIIETCWVPTTYLLGRIKLTLMIPRNRLLYRQATPIPSSNTVESDSNMETSTTKNTHATSIPSR
jgi:hypothetical protein